MRNLIALGVVVLLVGAARAEEGPRLGKWEYTAEMEIPGMPAMPQLPPGVQLPPGMKMPQMGPGGIKTTFTRCLTEEDLVPNNDRGQEHCTVTKMERSGNKVNWSATCETPNGTATGQGTATYSGDSMEATMTVKGSSPETGPFEMKQKTHGRYLGPCS